MYCELEDDAHQLVGDSDMKDGIMKVQLHAVGWLMDEKGPTWAPFAHSTS